MATPTAAATVRVVTSVGEIARDDWDRCANPPGAAYNPFVSHDFMWSLEESGAAVRKTGWQAQHLVLSGSDGKPAGILPCYLKSHSQGEYVFDHGWAEAYARAGGRYYPKLQASIPFTPVTGPRLLVRPGEDVEARRQLLARAGTELVRKLGVSSLNVTFATKAEQEILAAADYLPRTDQQFHFVNEGYGSFDGFLGALASRKRKAIKRERRDALEGGVEVVHLTGRDITEAAWDSFFAFYMDTGSRKWGRPYLNRKAFSLIGQAAGDRCLLIFAKRGKRPIAGSFHMIGGDCLFGRYWGATEHHPCLHFELCYYQAIDYAIAHKIARVEAGAQGEHKLARGYLPTLTYSAHYIADPSLRRAIAYFLERERAYVETASEELAEYAPFRKVPDQLRDET